MCLRYLMCWLLRNAVNVQNPPFSSAAACFNKSGDHLVYIENAKREILIVDYKRVRALAFASFIDSSSNLWYMIRLSFLLLGGNSHVMLLVNNLWEKCSKEDKENGI